MQMILSLFTFGFPLVPIFFNERCLMRLIVPYIYFPLFLLGVRSTYIQAMRVCRTHSQCIFKITGTLNCEQRWPVYVKSLQSGVNLKLIVSPVNYKYRFL